MAARLPEIICIGSVLWDIIGRTPVALDPGSDVAGRIYRLPGGVAFNIAMTLAGYGLRPALLSSVGRDAEGADLIAQVAAQGIDTGYLYRPDALATDRYMAIEGANGVIAAIADAHSLEQAGESILAPLRDGRLGDDAAPWDGLIALDGNLTEALLSRIAQAPALGHADLRVAPASPGKATRLIPLIRHAGATFYVNCEEAGYICGTGFGTAREAAEGLIERGARRAIVTQGAEAVCDAVCGGGALTCAPDAVTVRRLTGAGDTFMAAHIAAEHRGDDRAAALTFAAQAAARFVSGKDPV